ncbi:hypothetical protein EVAR_86058_1 [Eumeta japonica]|uniref:DNA helicase Pif1-like 2B domain-containing protein n=1 Tax=Eumeta variegata TaxID=151549 RepID=A0A4C1UJG2_EUMVA|nr:hypothetical protein EVAR_86058_1 [Eumeta japonica]
MLQCSSTVQYRALSMSMPPLRRHKPSGASLYFSHQRLSITKAACRTGSERASGLLLIAQEPTTARPSIFVPVLPPHKLKIKIGMPIILLRKLNPPTLCNGTRLQELMSLQRNVIEGRIISGCGNVGSDALQTGPAIRELVSIVLCSDELRTGLWP